jgi:putative ABC transport system permease protein
VSVGPGWRRLFRLSRDDEQSARREVDDEIEFHLAMRQEKLRRLGASPGDAEAEARTRFGDAKRVRDECITIDQRYAREMRLVEWIESVWADMRYAFRTLKRMPAFTLVATLTLALGIGATTAMFTLVDEILLRPLPYPNADRIVRLIQSYPEIGLDTWGVSQQNIAMYRDRATDFESFAGYRSAGLTLTADGRADRLDGAWVTADFFHVLGVDPARGRPFTREEDTKGNNNVAVLSDAFWRSRFGGRADAIGATIDLDGRPVRIVGVMPPGFGFPHAETQVWLPMGLDASRRFGWINSGIARLKPGVSIGHAREQTTAIMWDWARREPNLAGGKSIAPEHTHMATIVAPLQEAMTKRTARPLVVLLAAVGLILLIAISNVATLLSGRAAVRQREIDLRAALGATGGRVMRQLLTESLALALLGAAAGIALAFGAVRVFINSRLVTLPRRQEVHVDGRVLMVTLALSVTSGILFGLLPALHSVRARATGELATRATAQRSVRRLNRALVVAQLALSVVLLIAAGLMLKSFERLTGVDLGFRPVGITALALPLPPRYNSASTANPFFATVLESVRATPGVKSAALAWGLPFESEANYDGFLVGDRPAPPTGAEGQTYQVGVSPGYFATMGIPILFGRDVSAADDTTGVPVAVIDESIAKRYWRGSGAIGKRIRVTGDTTWLTIVGVVGAIYDDDATRLPAPHLYVSLAQNGSPRVSLAIRTDVDARAAIRSVQSTLSKLDSSIPLDGIRTLASVVGDSLATKRLTEILLAAFAAMAVLLAAVGIYGVMSLSVANRRQEFGVRLAVGAEPLAIIRLVLREGATVAALGVGIGVVGSLLATRWMASLLYDVSPTDPVVFISLSVLLGAVATAACYVPARRASKSDPLVALRAD